MHQRNVMLADDALLEGQAEAAQHLGPTGKQHQPGGGHVEPMNDQRVGIQRLNPARQTILPTLATRRHREQPRRLVGNNQRVVCVEDGGGEQGHGGESG